MQDYGKLEKLLKEKKYYSLNDLSKQLGKNEYKVRQDLLNYLNQEVEKLSIESNQKKCKHIYKIFKYLEDAKTERDKEQILIGLKKTYKICNTKLKKSKANNSNNVFGKIMSIIKVTLLNLTCEIQNVNNEVSEVNNYNLIKYIIFDLKNYNYLFELIKTFPKYLNIYENNKSIFEEIVDSYINHVYKNNFSSDLIYLEKVIKLFVNNQKFELNNDDKIKIMNKIKNSIIEINNNENIMNKDKAIFFLNELSNDINKNVRKDLNELYFKYDINNNQPESTYVHNDLKIDKDKVLDLRDKFVITIDGNATRVFDDACSIDRFSNGNYLLSVFVTDVASYVPRNSLIDKMAYEKSETLYMPKQVITMLPPGLTSDLTLVEKEDKQAIGHFFLLDKDANVLGVNIKKCIINVNKNYSYNEVTKTIMDSNNISELKLFNNMAELALKLHNNKTRQNYREIKSIKKNNTMYDSSIGNTIIVEFMTLTNYIIASIFNENKKYPFIYRINTGSYGDDIKREMFKLMGENQEIKERFAKLCPPSIYSCENLGHTGLNLDAYCHSTNPLRNYASLECQRLIIEHIINKDNTIDLEKEKQYIKELCEYMNNRINLNKVFIEECYDVKRKNYIDKQIKL